MRTEQKIIATEGKPQYSLFLIMSMIFIWVRPEFRIQKRRENVAVKHIYNIGF